MIGYVNASARAVQGTERKHHAVELQATGEELGKTADESAGSTL
jgi:hypothetical protein